ncbi:hypothetical protein KI387_042352, partial [Taxus chinensis]
LKTRAGFRTTTAALARAAVTRPPPCPGRQLRDRRLKGGGYRTASLLRAAVLHRKQKELALDIAL